MGSTGSTPTAAQRVLSIPNILDNVISEMAMPTDQNRAESSPTVTPTIAPAGGAAQKVLDTPELLEMILHEVSDPKELLKLALVSRTFKATIYGQNSVGHRLSRSKPRLHPPVWEVNFETRTIANCPNDHTLSQEETRTGLDILRPLVLNDFLFYDVHYSRVPFRRRLECRTELIGFKIPRPYLETAYRIFLATGQKEWTCFDMLISHPPVSEVGIDWMIPHPAGGYGSSGTRRLSVPGGVRLKDILSTVDEMQQQGCRVGGLIISGHVFVSYEEWNAVNERTSRPGRAPLKKYRWGVADLVFARDELRERINEFL